jgi:hypothetical protein
MVDGSNPSGRTNQQYLVLAVVPSALAVHAGRIFYITFTDINQMNEAAGSGIGPTVRDALGITPIGEPAPFGQMAAKPDGSRYPSISTFRIRITNCVDKVEAPNKHA